MHLHKAAHGVTSVEGSLRATENVDTLDVIKIEVECTLVEVRNVVNIHTYGRGVDARTDAADVHGRGEA